MKIVISCCKEKKGQPFRHGGKIINFVSRPDEADSNEGLYFHPDNKIPNEGQTWRSLIDLQQNRNDLITCHELYAPSIYKVLYNRYHNDFFIFSAGWGIVGADYKLPKYDITFSKKNPKIPKYSIRYENDVFKDFNHLLNINDDDEIWFISGSDYVLPFCRLASLIPNKKIVVYKSDNALENNPFVNNNKFRFLKYKTTRSTNWHYEYAEKLLRK